MNATSPFSLRLRNQLSTELRVLRWPAIGLLIALSLRLQMRLDSDRVYILQGWQTQLLGVIALLAIWIIATSIRRDAPSNTNTASLTRPIGGNVSWLAKFITLFLIIALPWLISDLVANIGYGHRFIHWMGITLASLLCSWLVISVTAAVMSLASSHRQAMIIIFCAAAAVMAWFLLFDSIQNKIKKNESIFIPENLKTCAEAVSAVFLLIVALIAWLMATVPRRRFIAAVFLAIGALQWPLVQSLWPYDWLTKPEQSYNQTTLTLNVGANVSNQSGNTQQLWPGLSLSGLAADEVATVIAFAPSTPNRKFTPGTFATDYAPESGNHAISTNYSQFQPDYIRSLLKQYSTTDLWQFRGAQKRLPLKFVLESPSIPSLETSWRLRLAIQQMLKIADIPLSDIWDQTKVVNLSKGQRMEIGPRLETSSGVQLTCWIRRNGSFLISSDDHKPIQNMQGVEIARRFILVFRNATSRELTPEFPFFSYLPYATRNMSFGWIQDFTTRCDNLNLPQPWAQMAMLGTTQEDWVKSTSVQIWTAEERGTLDMEVSAEEMKHVLEKR